MNDIDRQIEYGQKTIKKKNGTIAIKRSDFIYVYRTLQEFVSFFHQAKHYPNLKAVNRFIGNRKGGGYKAIAHAKNKILDKYLPPDIRKMIDEGKFDCPKLPFYMKRRG